MLCHWVFGSRLVKAAQWFHPRGSQVPRIKKNTTWPFLRYHKQSALVVYPLRYHAPGKRFKILSSSVVLREKDQISLVEDDLVLRCASFSYLNRTGLILEGRSGCCTSTCLQTTVRWTSHRQDVPLACKVVPVQGLDGLSVMLITHLRIFSRYYSISEIYLHKIYAFVTHSRTRIFT